MFKSYINLFSILLVAVVLFATPKIHAEATPGSFGINAEFGSQSDEAGLLYTISHNLEVGLGLTFKNESYTQDVGTAPDSKTTLGLSLYAAYYLSKGDINPYIGLNLSYLGLPKETLGSQETKRNNLGIEIVFGGQSFITKSFAVYAEIGLSYSMENKTETTNSKDDKSSVNMFKLFTSAVGATFYFN